MTTEVKKARELKEWANALNGKSNKLTNEKCPLLFSITEVTGGLNESSCTGEVEDRSKLEWTEVLNEEGNGNPPQYSCLENSVDRGAWWAAVYGVTQSDTTEAT